MEDKITINGIEYIPASGQDYKKRDHICVIVQNGWIFEGYNNDTEGSTLKLTNANVVRSWSNGRGIGGFACAEYKDEYTLDPIKGDGMVAVYRDKIIAVIPLEW